MKPRRERSKRQEENKRKREINHREKTTTRKTNLPAPKDASSPETPSGDVFCYCLLSKRDVNTSHIF